MKKTIKTILLLVLGFLVACALITTIFALSGKWAIVLLLLLLAGWIALIVKLQKNQKDE